MGPFRHLDLIALGMDPVTRRTHVKDVLLNSQLYRAWIDSGQVEKHGGSFGEGGHLDCGSAAVFAALALILSAASIWVDSSVAEATGGSDRTPMVATRKGAVRGLAELDVFTFRGVPCAAPPTGELGWKPRVVWWWSNGSTPLGNAISPEGPLPNGHGPLSVACDELSVLRQHGSKLPARGDVELAEDLPEMPFDSACADVQLGANLEIGQTACGSRAI